MRNNSIKNDRFLSQKFARINKSVTFAFAKDNRGSYQSGQMGLTVTQIAYAYGGSNPSLPTYFAEVAQLIEH